MNKEILSTINQSTARFMKSESNVFKDICGHVVNILPALLEVDNHPTSDEENLGKGDCTTAYKYFKESTNYLLPHVQIYPQIVQRSVWEPMEKRASIHLVANVGNENTKYQVDATHFMGPGYGQVNSDFNLHTTMPITNKDIHLIDRFNYVKHLYAHSLPQAEYEATQIFSIDMPTYMNSWKADLELIRLNSLLSNEMAINDIVDSLRTITNLNPFKAGVLKTINRLSEFNVDTDDRFTGIQTEIQNNMKKLHQSAMSASANFIEQSLHYFKNNDIKKGLNFLRLAWWTQNIAESKIIPISKLSPLEFKKQNLITLWIDRFAKLPRNLDILFQEEINLQDKQVGGYKPIDLSSNRESNLNKIKIMIIKPNDSQTLPNIKKAGIHSIYTGALGLLNSIGVLYPYLTNVDKFSIRSHKLLERVK
ncbi:MAG: hypothetical protein ACD_19C00176G0045 [uncultured bacterium]|nr:MAG: hypothetical protein ACD_19C00176G0045 [uncultured bacterium]